MRHVTAREPSPRGRQPHLSAAAIALARSVSGYFQGTGLIFAFARIAAMEDLNSLYVYLSQFYCKCKLLMCPRILSSARKAFRAFIPELHNRIPITWRTIPFTFIPFVPFVLLAYLARRPDTNLLRLLLLPIVIVMSLGTAYRYDLVTQLT